MLTFYCYLVPPFTLKEICEKEVVGCFVGDVDESNDFEGMEVCADIQGECRCLYSTIKNQLEVARAVAEIPLDQITILPEEKLFG